MEIKVLIERLGTNGYQARAGEPFGLIAEGATPDEALRRLQDVVAEKVAAGATVVSLEVPVKDHPWLRMAGTLKGHPLLEDWKQAMAEYRQTVEDDPDRL
jgi:predicted RNase H-like HicB family nuclease